MFSRNLESSMHWRTRGANAWVAKWILAVALILPSIALANPVLRYQQYQRGNQVWIGNTIAQDCASGVPNPVVGTVGACGSNVSDTAPDIFFVADNPNAGQATANTNFLITDARSTAVLTLPAGAQVSYARLYWGAEVGLLQAGVTATFERPGSFTASLTADATSTATYNALLYYQSSVDVTSWVQTWGSGAYRVGNIASVALPNRNDQADYIGWTLVVFYTTTTDPPRMLALADGLDVVQALIGSAGVFGNFVVPTTGLGATLWTLGYEGDATILGDSIAFNNLTLGDALNPCNNFFNSTHANLGVAVSNLGDLPQTSGLAASMSGIDIDAVNVTSKINPGDTNAIVVATTTSDVYMLGAVGFAVNTVDPIIALTLTYTNLTHTGGVRAGDTLQYTLNAANYGNDAAAFSLATAALPLGLSYIPGTLNVTSGSNPGSKTDGLLDDQAEYNLLSNTITWRMGSGANAITGGNVLPTDGNQTLTFNVVVNSLSGLLPIQTNAFVTTIGTQSYSKGLQPLTFSSGNGSVLNANTVVVIDACLTSADCTAPLPHCDTTVSPHVCTGCLVNSECSGATPACNANLRVCVRCMASTDCPNGAVCANQNTCTVLAPTITSPMASGTINTPVATVKGTAPAGGNVTIYIDGVVAGTGVADPNGNFSIATGGTSLGAGLHAAVATVTVGSGAGAVLSPNSITDYFTVINGCLQNSDCNGSTPVCNTSTNVCVQCMSTSDCATGATCSASRMCTLVAPTVNSPANGLITNASTLTISGTSVPNANVIIALDSASVASVTSNASGFWTYTTTAPTNGNHTVSAKAAVGSGAAQVTSSSSATNTFTQVTGCLFNSDCSGATPVCRTTDHNCVGCSQNSDCPTTATCSSNTCTLAAPSLMGPGNGALVNIPNPSIAGTALANNYVTLSIDGGSSVTVQAGSNGAFSYTPSASLAPGSHTVTATAKAINGNQTVTSTSTSETFTVISGCLSASDCNGSTPVCNTTSHACVRCAATSDCPTGATCSSQACVITAPVIVAPANNALLSSTIPTLSGTSTPRISVVASIDGAQVGTTTADANGNWSLALTQPLSYAVHTVSAVSTSGAGPLQVNSASSGNTTFSIVNCATSSDCSNPKPICVPSAHVCAICATTSDCTVGSTCQSQSCVVAAATIVTPPPEGTINQSQPIISGTSAAGSQVSISVDGGVIGTVTASNANTWALTPNQALAVGRHSITATAVVSDAGIWIYAPAVNSNFTVVSGCLAASDCNGSTPVCNTSNNQCVACNANADCPAASATCQAHVCTLPSPSITSPLANATINANQPTISGTAVPNSNITILLDGVTLATTQANSSGVFSVQALTAIAAGSHTLTALTSLSSGAIAMNSAPSTGVNFTEIYGCLSSGDCSGSTPVCQTSSHTCLQCATSGDCPTGASCGTSNTCTITAPTVQAPSNGATLNQNKPSVVGTAVANSKVLLTLDGNAWGSALTNSLGVFSFNPNVALALGNHQLSAVSTLAGNGFTVLSPNSTNSNFLLVAGCLSASDCGGATPACNTLAHQCVRCVTAVDCPTGAVCGGNFLCSLATPAILSPATGTTINQQPLIQGVSAPGATVTLLVDGVSNTSAVANANGVFALTPSPVLAVGTHTLTVQATTGSGVTSVASAAGGGVTLTLVNGCLSNSDCGGTQTLCRTSDNNCVRCLASSDCPYAAVCSGGACMLAAPTISTPASGGILNTNDALITGNAPALASVAVTLDGNVVGTTLADALGHWVYDTPGILSAGTHTVSAMASQGPGINVVFSPASATTSFTRVIGCLSATDCNGLTPACNTSTNQCARCVANSDCPTSATCSAAACQLAAPVVSAPTNGSSTSNTRPVLSGTAPAMTTVKLTVDGNVLTTVLSDGSGNWSWVPVVALGVGTHQVSAMATSGVGGLAVTSAASNSPSFQIFTCVSNSDCTAPSSICDTTQHLCVGCLSSTDCTSPSTCQAETCVLATPAITFPTNGNTFNDPNLKVKGTCAPGAMVQISDNGVPLPQIVCGSGGNFSVPLSAVLAGGNNAVSAVATTVSGGITQSSAVSAVVNFVYVSGCLLNTDCNGLLPVCRTATNTCVRCAANSDCPTQSTCQSNACFVASPNVITPLDFSFINNNTPNISGTAPANSNVVVSLDANFLAAVVADASGNWNFTPAPLSLGVHTLNATATVGSGVAAVSSAQSTTRSFYLVVGCVSNTDCPVATPFCNAVTYACYQCQQNTDCPTGSTCSGNLCTLAAPIINTAAASLINTTHNTISGTSIPGSTINLLVDGTIVGAAVTNSNGTFTASIPVTLSSGDHSVSATATIGNSNITVFSSTSSSVTLTWVAGCVANSDCSAAQPYCVAATHACVACRTGADCPAAATCGATGTCSLAAPNIVAPVPGAVTNVAQIQVSGTAPLGSLVQVVVDGVSSTSVAADGNTGAWMWTAPAPLSVATHTLSATASSGALTSLPSASQALTIIGGCLSNTDCSGSTPTCRTTDHTCVRCNVYNDCPGASSCVSSQCQLVPPTILTPLTGTTVNTGSFPTGGLAPPGSTVVLRIDGVIVGTTTADSYGLWTYIPTSTLGVGTHSVTASAQVGSGVLAVGSAASPAVMVNVVSGCLQNSDCAASAPVCRTDVHVCVRCISATDCPTGATCAANTCNLGTPAITAPSPNAILASRQPTITGTAGPNLVVVITLDGNGQGIQLASDANGNWSYALPQPLAFGNHTVYAIAYSGSPASFVASAPSSTVPFTLVACNTSSDCGNGLPTCNTTTHNCSQCLVDNDCSAGGTCVAGICGVLPPTILMPLANSITNTNYVMISGLATASSNVTITADYVLVTSTAADMTGAWTTLLGPLNPGSHVVTATSSIDQNGLTITSLNSNSVPFRTVNGCLSGADCTLQTPQCRLTDNVCVACLSNADCPTSASCINFACTLPAPVLAAPLDGSTLNTGVVTISGTSVPGASVTVSVDGTPVSTTTADTHGIWAVVPGGTLGLGTHVTSAVATLTRNGLSVQSLSSGAHAFTIISGCLSASDCSTTAPICRTDSHACVQCLANTDCPLGTSCSNNQCLLGSPVVTAPSDGQVINIAEPLITGTAAPNATVVLNIDGNTCTMNADANGQWQRRPLHPIGVGTHILTATASLTQGTLVVSSQPSLPQSFIRIAGCLQNSDCSGDSPTCRLSDNTCVDCVTNADCPGGAVCGGFLCSLMAPIILSNITNGINPQPTVSGTAVPNTTVELLVDGSGDAQVIADGFGQWSVPVSTNLGVGPHTVQAISIATLGANQVTSAASNVYNYTVLASCNSDSQCAFPYPRCDLTTHGCTGCLAQADCAYGPLSCNLSSEMCQLAAPIIAVPTARGIINQSMPSLSGTSVPGASVSLNIDGNIIGNTSADGNGLWKMTDPIALALGNHNVTATATLTIAGYSINSPISVPTPFTLISGCLTNNDCFGSAPICRTTDHTCLGCLTSTDCPGSATCDPLVNHCLLAPPVITVPSDLALVRSTSPQISGTAPPNSTVRVAIDGGTNANVIFLSMVDTNVIYLTHADANGTWGAQVPATLPTGTHTAIATALAQNGNNTVTSLSSAITRFTITNGCLADADCPSVAPQCDTTTNQCQECVDNTDCPTGANCVSFMCVLSAPTITAPANGAVLSSATPTVSGTSTPGAGITIVVDGNSATGLADAQGNWSVVSPNLVVGNHNVTATSWLQTSGMMLVSNSSAVTTFSTVSGCVQNSDCSGSLPVCRVSDHSCQACLSDNDCASTAQCISAACVLPPPVITAPLDGSTSSITQPVISGTAVYGQQIIVSVDGNTVDSTPTNTDGTFSHTLVRRLNVGTHVFSAVASAGTPAVTSVPSNQVSVTIASCSTSNNCGGVTPICGPQNICIGCQATSDCATGSTCDATGTCAIAAPVIVNPNNQSVTNSNTPLVTGTAPPNTRVVVSIDGNNQGGAPTDGLGNWSLVPTNPLPAGEHTIQAYATAGSGAQMVRSDDANAVLFFIVSGCATASDCASSQVCSSTTHTCVGCNASADCPVGATCSPASTCLLAAPVVLSPSENASVTAQSWYVSGTAPPLVQVNAVLDSNAASWTGTSDAQGHWVAPIAAPSAAGRHTLYVTAQSGPVKSATTVQHATFIKGCLQTSDCSGTTPICDTTARSCVECLQGTDCPFTPVCFSNTDANCFTIGYSGCTAEHCVLAPPKVSHPTAGLLTQNKSNQWSGMATPRTSVTVVVDGNMTQTTTVSASGVWSLTFSTPLGIGAHTGIAYASAGTGSDIVTSTNTGPIAMQVVAGCVSDADCSSTAPWCDPNGICAQCLVDAQCIAGAQCLQEVCVAQTPVIVTPGDGAITVNPVLSVSGTSKPYAAVLLGVDGALVTSCLANSTGYWVCTPPASFSVGTHQIEALATVGSGRTLTFSQPAIPHTVYIIAGCLSSDDCSGTAPFCDPVKHTCERCLTDADCPMSATCLAGVCTVAPPVIALPSDHSVTSQTEPVISGTAVLGGTVNLFLDGAHVADLPVLDANGTVTFLSVSGGNGTWSYAPPNALGRGDHNMYATTTVGADDIMVTSIPCASSSFRVSTQCNTSSDCYGDTPYCDSDDLCVRCLNDDECAGAATCNSSHECIMPTPVIVTPGVGTTLVTGQPTFTGTAPPGAVAQINLDGNTVASVPVNSSGTWTYTSPHVIHFGRHSVTVTATLGTGTDVVTSASSAPVTFTLSPSCATSSDCGNTPQTPVCDANSNCVACTQDYGMAGGSSCPFATAPVCKSASGCTTCSSGQDCVGSTHPGPYCDVDEGDCSPTCDVDADCPAGQACAAGTCNSLAANGQPVPGGVTCTASIGQRLCSSEVCDTDNRCGLANGRPCNGSGDCRSDVCETDARCGAVNGDTCNSDAMCRSGVCASDGFCGALPTTPCTASLTCRSAVCSSRDSECGLPNGSMCIDGTTCRSLICAADGICGASLGSPCAHNIDCRTNICANGVCSQHCSSDAQCSDDTWCDTTQARCFTDGGLGAPCTRGTQCVANVCGSDQRCGAVTGQACSVTSECRAGACVGGVCSNQCDPNGQCSGATYCDNQNLCSPTLANNQPCLDDNQCTSQICGTDGACGAAARSPCTVPTNCRSGICSANKRCSANCASDAECAAGQFCDPNRNCTPTQPNLSPCSADDQCTSETCSPEGYCGIDNGAPCEDPNICQSGTCAADNLCGWPLDHTCTDGIACRSGACISGTCQSCSDDEQCAAENHACDFLSGSCKLKAVVAGKYTLAGDGGSCAQTSPSVWGVLGCLGAWALLRRRARDKLCRAGAACTLLVSAVWLMPQTAHAVQHVVLQRNVISALNEPTFWITRPRYAVDAPEWNAGLAINYAHDPLMLGAWKGNTFVPSHGVLINQLLLAVVPSVSFGNRWSITLRIPFSVWQSGNNLAGVAPVLNVTFADPSVRGMVRIVGNAETDPISAHFSLQVSSAVNHATLSHPGNINFTPRFILAGKIRHITWSTVLGVWFRHGRPLSSVGTNVKEIWFNELQGGLAVGYQTSDGKWHFGPELFAATYTTTGFAFNRAGSTAEVVLGTHWRPTPRIHAGVALSRGILQQQGTPDWRVQSTVSFSSAPERLPPPTMCEFPEAAYAPNPACPQATPTPTPTQAQAQAQAQAPEPTPTPSTEARELALATPAPAPVPAPAPTRQTLALEAVPQHPSTFATPPPPPVMPAPPPAAPPPPPRVAAAASPCIIVPLLPPVIVAPAPTPVVAAPVPPPVVATRPIVVADPNDACVVHVPAACRSQLRIIVDDANNAFFPPLPPAAAPLCTEQPTPSCTATPNTDEAFLISQHLNYAPDKFDLKPDHVVILGKVRALIAAHPEMHVCVDGHTDTTGMPELNRALSLRRATTVRDWLVHQGIDPTRLSAHGYSFLDPITSNSTPEGRAENRRVSFALCH